MPVVGVIRLSAVIIVFVLLVAGEVMQVVIRDVILLSVIAVVTAVVIAVMT